MIVRKKGEWLTARIGEELVMMSPDKGKYIGLTEVGARIWEMIETPSKIEDVCTRLQLEYDIGAQACRAEVEAFLEELSRQEAVTLDAQAP